MSEQDNTQLNNILAESAQYVNAVGPQLEKFAAMQQDCEKLCKIAASVMVENGVIPKSDESKVAADLLNGGLNKVAEAFKFVASTLSKPQTMGKAAAVSQVVSRPRTADEVWEAHFNLGNQ